MQASRWTTFSTETELRHAAIAFVLQCAQSAIAARGRFDIVLSGGHTPKSIYEGLCDASADWASWHVWHGDERCLPPEHEGRNSKMAHDAWLAHVSIPADHIHLIAAELGAIEAARLYSSALKDMGEFDLVLLGLGEDGHTASLFPGHAWESQPPMPAIPVSNAPKPPPDRVSMSASRLSLTKNVLYIVTGSDKQSAVNLWKNGAALPMQVITPENGADVYLDVAAVPV